MLRSVFKEGNLHLHGPWTRKASLAWVIFPGQLKTFQGRAKSRVRFKAVSISPGFSKSWKIWATYSQSSSLMKRHLPVQLWDSQNTPMHLSTAMPLFTCWSKQMTTEDVGKWAFPFAHFCATTQAQFELLIPTCHQLLPSGQQHKKCCCVLLYPNLYFPTNTLKIHLKSLKPWACPFWAAGTLTGKQKQNVGKTYV